MKSDFITKLKIDILCRDFSIFFIKFLKSYQMKLKIFALDTNFEFPNKILITKKSKEIPY